MSTKRFHHERLDVYRVAIQFVGWTGEMLEGPLQRSRQNATKHLDESSTSVPLNIAEGNGRRSPRDRCRFFDIAKSSALESSACLDVLVARNKLEEGEISEGKDLLVRIVEMLRKMNARLLEPESSLPAG